MGLETSSRQETSLAEESIKEQEKNRLQRLNRDGQAVRIEADPQSLYVGKKKPPSNSRSNMQSVVFHWPHRAQKVYLVTSHDNWEATHELRRSQTDFTAILRLPPGVHWYKFLVDGKWTCARDQPYRQEQNGGYVNFVNVLTTSELSSEEDFPFSKSNGVFVTAYSKKKEEILFNESFSQKLPNPSFFGLIPEAPPHLGKIVLNEWPSGLQIRKPTSAEIDHLYLAQHVPNDIMSLGLTSRYRNKTYTTIYLRTAPVLKKRREN